MTQNIKTTVMDILLWIIWVPSRTIIRHLPLQMLYCLACIAARAACRVDIKGRRTLMREFRMIFPKKSYKELRQLVRGSYINYFKRHAESLVYETLSRQWHHRNITIRGLRHLDQALAKKKGALIILEHFGSFLLVPSALAHMNYRVSQLTGPPELKHHRRIHRLITSLRIESSRDLPFSFLVATTSLKKAISRLKKNECLVWAFDGRTGKGMMPVTLFGLPAFVSAGPVKASLMTGAPIVPAFIIRNNDNTHTLILEPPFEPERSSSTKAFQVEAGTRFLAKLFEGYVNAFPDHYGMILKIMRGHADAGVIDTPLIVTPEKPTPPPLPLHHGLQL